MTALTLPGTIPGLLRRGSPVVLLRDRHEGSCLSLLAGAKGVVLSVEDAGAWVLTTAPSCNPRGRPWPSSRWTGLALDLTDATGRAHAAWWVGEHAAMLLPAAARDVLWVHEQGERMWSLWAPEHDTCDVFGPYEDDAHRVPALAHLDPDDPRRLPDGSRWVDAEALRLVVLHVAEVAP